MGEKGLLLIATSDKNPKTIENLRIHYPLD